MTEIEKFAKFLARELESKSDADRISENAAVLIGESFDFGSYFVFALRYGFLEDPLEVLLQLSDPDRFHPWFQPQVGEYVARLLLRSQSGNAWFVRVADASGTFLLTYRREERVLITPVTFNPLRAEERLAVDLPEGPAFSADWASLLYSVLHLNSQECIQIEDFGWEMLRDGEGIARAALASQEAIALNGIAVPIAIATRQASMGVLTW